ncbi:hypothetical protein DKX38_019903 [Salix brachista]|uniref:TIR domain-containing protein n=1 Tax=Salix brachista TaxID=2182728 RepID=A0A5N5KHH6_9ROSI|nr:hypothetical protein DKX38_019903 [Salix brachista]
MASTSTQKATSSSYSPPPWIYDVFLSFCGKDTRQNFTSHLCSNLRQGGIDVYMDDTELERGKTIEPALWQAIEESRFSIVVFSRNYASSPWCLDELVKIVQCMKEMGHTALPVFYDVDPSEVANQTGDYKKAFIEHQEKFSENPDRVRSWRDCLSTVAYISGWDVQDRNESQLIEKILEWIKEKLSFTLPTISKKLVGIDSPLKELNRYMDLDEKANDILFIGISGMGGMGKTTIARVWNHISSFQHLANVREVFAEKDGPSRLQKQLLLEINMEVPTERDSSRIGKTETIFLDMPRAEEAKWKKEAFSKMTKLRLLKIHNVNVSEGPEYLSNKLRFLEWHAYPSKSLPACFKPENLVELYMSFSSIEQLWYERKDSNNLKIINLSNSLNLTNTPDFTGIPNLESLNLEGCRSLSEVHPSFGRHKKLQFVNLVNCISLRILPSNLEMESLKSCTLNGCSKLDKFPDIVGNMNCLRELRLDGTAITELPSSFNRLAGLVLLNMSSCKNLESIPSSISGLKSLKKLDVSDCSELKNIPENLGKVESLEEFDASGTSIRQPPASFFLLKNLKVLSFNGCKRLAVNLTDQVLPSLSGLCSLEELDLRACNLGEGAVPEDIGFLSSLRSLNLSENNFVSLPKSINQLSRLEKLALKDCVMLESLPEVPLKVQKVKLDGCLRLKEIPDPIKLNNMERSEFKCLNCWELYKHNGQNNMGLSMLEKYLQGSLPRPGFGIVVPGNDVPDWFNHQSKESSIRVQIPRTDWMGFAACVAFSAYGKSPLFCQFKVDGKESYPSPMYIGCNSMQVVSDHLWLFYLSFDYLKDLKEQKNEAFNNLELSFNSYEQGVKVKNCGVHLVNSSYTPSWQSPIGHLIVASKEAASSYIDSLANSLSYNQWMHDVFCSLRGVHSSNNFTHLYTALIQKGIIHDSELENLRSIESSLLGEIKESGLSVIIFARDYACSPWWVDELVKIVGFIKKMKPDTVFPVSTVSYNVEQSKVDERTESYMIVFEKDEEDFGENKEKVQRWRNILTEVTIPSSESSKRVNDMDWPVGNKFHGTDLESVLNFMKKIRGEGNERDIDFEFDVTQLVKS